MIYLCGLDPFSQKNLTNWLSASGLPKASSKAAEKLSDLQAKLEQAKPTKFDSEDTTNFSKILLTQGKSIFRHHRNLENLLWPVSDAGFELHFWLEVDPKAKLLLHFDEPEFTLARHLHIDQRNAFKAENL